MTFYTHNELYSFVHESNRIEPDVHDTPTPEQIDAHIKFFTRKTQTLDSITKLVQASQPNARLRSNSNLNVRIGNHFPPQGGMNVVYALEAILTQANKRVRDESWKIHVEYEILHPFTDGNGRSGRALWAWVWQDLSLGFLHRFYYQTLNNQRQED